MEVQTGRGRNADRSSALEDTGAGRDPLGSQRFMHVTWEEGREEGDLPYGHRSQTAPTQNQQSSANRYVDATHSPLPFFFLNFYS